LLGNSTAVAGESELLELARCGKPYPSFPHAKTESLVRILVLPVDGSASANRAAAHAAALADGRADECAKPGHARYLGHLSVVSVGADTALAVDNSQKALRYAIRLGRDAQVNFETRACSAPSPKQSTSSLAKLRLTRKPSRSVRSPLTWRRYKVTGLAGLGGAYSGGTMRYSTRRVPATNGAETNDRFAAN
jgi:hypothetical protein